jgi:hypothetical protein
MAAGFPLSRQAPQPERATEPPAANKAPNPPAPSTSEHRPLVLPGVPELYRFEALEIKELCHRLDGVLWPRQSTGCAETGSPEFPVVLLEEQMHPDSGSHHRLAAKTYRFLRQHPRVEHWAVLVITPHNRLKLGPTPALQLFLKQVDWINLEELSQQPDLDPLLNRRCGPLTAATTAQIQALPLDQLEALAEALLDFQGPADLAAWLAAPSTNSA